MNKKIRPIGEIMFDVEDILDEMCVSHQMQWHEVLGLIYASLQLHYKESQEEFLDGSKPVFKYEQYNKNV